MNILFLNPYNQQVVYIESIAQGLSIDNEIFLLTFDSWGKTHDNFSSFGARCYGNRVKMLRVPILLHLHRLVHLIRFIRKNRIEIIYSHYQEANLIAVIAQYFVKGKFIITRHHSDCAYQDKNLKERVGDNIINRLAKIYIAPSALVFNHMVEMEGVKESKITRLDYGYNFENFEKPQKDLVKGIREKYDCDLLIVKAARLIPEKRHSILIDVIFKLRNEGINCKVLFLGQGPHEDELKDRVKNRGLEGTIEFLGYKTDIPNYYSAADLIVHLSVSEASNSAIKEAALTGTTVAVCADVGDFGDYINEANGFILPKANPEGELEKVIKFAAKNKSELEKLGHQLKNDVTNRFDIKNVLSEYVKLNKR